jgi:hypothetical protein
MLNRRNAVLGWSVWQLSKTAAKRKAKSAASPSGHSKKSLVAVSVAGIVGALTFWRKRRSDDA